MRAIILAFAAAFPSIATAEAPVYNEEYTRSNCTAEWGTDYQMIEYCISQQEKGFRKFEFMLVNFAEQMEYIGPSFDYCREEWGQDWGMVSYCAENQAQGPRKVMDAIEGIPSGIANTIVSQCDSQWAPDYTMIAYCADRQATSWRRINGG